MAKIVKTKENQSISEGKEEKTEARQKKKKNQAI